jgi:hypothetical protein
MPKPRAIYRTPQRARGARSAGTDPRPGELPDRGGQKNYVGDPGEMKPTGKTSTQKRRRKADR